MSLTLAARTWNRIRPAASAATVETKAPAVVDPARQQLLSQIFEFNPSACPAFLNAFENSALRTYLDHLHAAQIPRGRNARWVRPGDSPAIMWRERRD